MKTTVRGLKISSGGGSEWFPRAFFCKAIDQGLADDREEERAQLVVSVGPVNVVGAEVSVALWLTNGLPTKIESARANCYLYDRRGFSAGQATRWIIGGSDTNGLAAGAVNHCQVLITADESLATTNLRARIEFRRLVLDGGELADVTKLVRVTSAAK